MLKNNKNPLLTDWKTSQTNPAANIPSDEEWGVDWIKLRIDIDPSSIDLSSPMWTVNRKGKEPKPDIVYDSYFIKIPFGNTSVDGYFFLDSWRINLEFNPSTALYGKTKAVCPADAVVPLVSKLLDQCSSLFMPVFDHADDRGTITRETMWVDQVWLSRVDCTRNLYIHDAERFKDAIEAATPRNQKSKHIRTSGNRGWTVENQTSTVGMDSVYNKDAELAMRGSPNTVDSRGTCFRFESKLKADRLDKFGLRRLSNISSQRIWHVIETRWNACQWDVTFAEPGTLAKAIAHLKPSEKTGLLGYLGKHQLGLEQEIAGASLRKYGSIAKSLGLVLGAPLESQGAVTQYVDIFSGAVINRPEKP